MRTSTKKLTQALLVTTLLTAGVAPSIGAAPSIAFKDVPKTNVHHEDIYNLANRGVLTGYKDGTYKPAGHLTRAEAAAILTRALEIETTDVVNPGFKDVKKDDWFYDEVAALAEYEIFTGFPDGTFKPNEKLTRAQMAKILTESYELYTVGGETPFRDVPQDKWFAEYVHGLHYFGVTNGVTATTYEPNSFVRRDAIASFVVRSEEVPEEMKVEVIVELFTELFNEESTGLLSANLDTNKNVITIAVQNSDRTVRDLVRSDAFLLLPYFAFYSAYIGDSFVDLSMADDYEVNDEFLSALGVTESTPLNEVIGKSVTITLEDYSGNTFDYTYKFTAK